MEDRQSRHATVADVHELARAMPHVTCLEGSLGKPIYQVGGKSFIFFRNPRPDAKDPVTGERYDDVIVFWVESEADKEALVRDPETPFFTTPHFNGYPAVLMRIPDLARIDREELGDLVGEAWLSRAQKRVAKAWLAEQPDPAD